MIGRASALSIDKSRDRDYGLHRFLLLAALFATSTLAQETTLHVDVKLVSVFVNVTDRNGALVGGLTRDDFALSEDGRPQQIAVFEKQSEMPLNLILAIDTSGSVRKDLSGRGGGGAAICACDSAPAGPDERNAVCHRT